MNHLCPILTHNSCPTSFAHVVPPTTFISIASPGFKACTFQFNSTIYSLKLVIFQQNCQVMSLKLSLCKNLKPPSVAVATANAQICSLIGNFDECTLSTVAEEAAAVASSWH
ncbi:hypothetical protein T4B_9150 [Trichinella pseudospiralis]|uniref:Uncharacterized protein n=1 Tax=Trichinella pseudospiralis TaxID=6337 RepID=A0A0V1HV22_TRIPS|nr:hypothetical protein T4B_9150 [Trichinella pseudospiralis]